MRNCWLPIWKAVIYSSGKEIEGLRGGVRWYAAQAKPMIDTTRGGITLSGRKLISVVLVCTVTWTMTG
ncbi:MAG: hypothetical protein PHD01_02575 [Geobacteraceae bacterium]|nr:hypothetical protein [Geobacteraceae bacterium]